MAAFVTRFLYETLACCEMKHVGDEILLILVDIGVLCCEAISNLASFNPNNKQARAIQAMTSYDFGSSKLGV